MDLFYEVLLISCDMLFLIEFDYIDFLTNSLNFSLINSADPKLSLGYLPIGRVDLERSFNTTDMFSIWELLSQHLDIFQIEVNGIQQTFDYCWSDLDYKQKQINMLKPGYDYSSRG